MRFEISYQGGTTHEVELPGHLCVVGRDPGCDIVLNDAKCSRRHAVIEETPEGVTVRDSGSANGIYVNGKKVESSPLRPGDTLRMGEVKLRLLPEIGETVIVGPEGINFDVSVSGPTQLEATPAEQPVPGCDAGLLRRPLPTRCSTGGSLMLRSPPGPEPGHSPRPRRPPSPSLPQERGS
jgi:predicted component of type VI protein secretion system